MLRGDIWWADLPVPEGAGPGYRRPVLVMQADSFNSSRISTVVTVVMSSNLRLAAAPGNVVVPIQESGLLHDSVVNVSQIIMVDKQFLTDHVGRVRAQTMQAIETVCVWSWTCRSPNKRRAGHTASRVLRKWEVGIGTAGEIRGIRSLPYIHRYILSG